MNPFLAAGSGVSPRITGSRSGFVRDCSPCAIGPERFNQREDGSRPYGRVSRLLRALNRSKVHGRFEENERAQASYREAD